MWNKGKIARSLVRLGRAVGPGAVIVTSSVGVALLLAWLERFGYISLGLNHLPKVGLWIWLALSGLVVAHAFGRCLTWWVVAAAALASASLLLDALPLLVLGKSQVAVLVIGLSQWACTYDEASKPLRRVVVLAVFFSVGALIEAAYFLALMQNHNVVVFF
jgi:hypothetical protein